MMPTYIQMGHNSENLVGEVGLEKFSGIILSPVNRSPQQLDGDIVKFQKKGNFEYLLDTQLYYPTSDRGFLSEHSYMPDDFDTFDYSSQAKWLSIAEGVAKYVTSMGFTAITSAACEPRVWRPDYYSLITTIANETKQMLPVDFLKL